MQQAFLGSSLVIAPKRSLSKVFTITTILWISLLAVVLVFTRNDPVLQDPGLALERLIAVPMVPIAPIAKGTQQPEGPKNSEKPDTPQNSFVSQKEPPQQIAPSSAGPPRIPTTSVISEGPPGSPGDPNGSEFGVKNGVVNGVLGGRENVEAPPPPPIVKPAPKAPDPVPETKPAVTEPLRKSGGVFAGSAIRKVEPAYPAMARTARISGAVVVEVTVDEEGVVTNVRALSGHPLLRDAALSAAKQWKFSPTKLSGVAVKVIGTITFNFNL